jgi:hypothetical protein
LTLLKNKDADDNQEF